MKNREKFTFNVENFAKNLSYERHELKISIKRYKKKIVNTKNVLNEYFRCDFNIRVLIFCCAKYIMTFFVNLSIIIQITL